MYKKVLLLDYDGIVLRNSIATNLITNRASYYTRNVISQKNNYLIDSQASKDLCQNLYKGYGHTLLGLKAIGFNTLDLKHYNQYVYSHIDYDELIRTNNDMLDIQSIIDFCNDNNIQIYTYSNAPKIWIENTLKKNKNILNKLVDIRDVLHVRDDCEELLKPLPYIYDLIDKHFDKNTKFIFVDDSMYNLKYPLSKENWINVLYCGIDTIGSKNMLLIRDMKQLEQIINLS